jgi:plastocyanin
VLTAGEFDWEIMPGTTVRAWGYDGQVPGPELRVTEGDRVRVTLRNQLPVPTTIHWHGVNVPPAMDGPAGLNQAPVEPGTEFVYDFVATPAGTRWYHSHADPALQEPLGLYGPLIIEPRVPTRAYDREYTYILQECDLELTPAVASGTAQRGPRDRLLRGGELGSDLFLINGHAHDAISRVKLAEGERVLLRFINAGHLPHAVHLHGHSFTIVATDGNPVPEAAQLTKDTVLVGPAERYDLAFVGDNPGVWMLHCHMEHHMANGMMTLVQYDGAVPTGPAAAFFDPEGATGSSGTGHGSHGGHGGATATPPPPTPTAEPRRLPVPRAPPDEGEGDRPGGGHRAAHGPSAYDQLGTEQAEAMLKEGRALIAQQGAATPATGDADAVHEVAVGVESHAGAEVLQFLPREVAISVGDTVRWTNLSMHEPHTVTFLGNEDPPEFILVEPQEAGPPTLVFNPIMFFPAGGDTYDGTSLTGSGAFGPELAEFDDEFPRTATYELTFTAPGAYRYYCAFHSGSLDDEHGMVGTVTVT